MANDSPIGTRAEIEIALRDNLSPGLQKMARDVRALNRSIKALGDDGQAGYERVSKSTSNLSTVTRTAVRDLTVMGSLMSGFTKGLIGSIGTAAAIEGVVRAINNLAQSRVQLSMFAQDTRFSAEHIHSMRGAMARMGIEAKQADTYIGGMSTKLQELGALRQGSTLFRDLQSMGPGGVELGNQLMADVSAGKYKDAMKNIIDVYKKQGPEAKFWMSQILGIPQSVLENMEQYRLKTRNTFLDNEDAMKQYLSSLEDLKEYGGDQFTRFASHVVTELNKIISKLSESKGSNALSDWLIQDFDNVLAKARATKEEIEAIINFARNLNESLKPDSAKSAIQERFGAFGLGSNPNLKSRIDQAIEDIEKEQSRTLIDIRDILKRMEEDATTGGKERGDYSNYGRGVRSEGGSARATLGGFRPNRANGEAPGDALPIGPNNPDTAGARYLAERRKPFREELDNNPRTRELLGALISAENPGAGPAVAESLFNRTELVNRDRARRGLAPLTLEDMMRGHPSIGGGKSFYGPMRSGAVNSHLDRMRRDPAYAAAMNERIRQALSGSNTIRGYTDQGSAGDPNYHSGGVGVNINRERFNNWRYRGAAEFQRELDAEFNRRNAARESVDKERRGSVWEAGTAAITVDFNGVPRGVKTDAKADGVFKELRVNREPQSPKAGDVPGSDFNSRWYFQ